MCSTVVAELDFVFAGCGQARTRSVEDQEPEQEREGADGHGDREDPPESAGALIVARSTAHEDPRLVKPAADRERAEQQGEQPGERDEEPEADAPRSEEHTS